MILATSNETREIECSLCKIRVVRKFAKGMFWRLGPHPIGEHFNHYFCPVCWENRKGVKAMEKALNPVINGRVSDELYGKSIGMINGNPMGFSAGYKTRIIHMIDATSRGYITPLEAYAALEADYFPSFLEVRPSKYQHLIK